MREHCWDVKYIYIYIYIFVPVKRAWEGYFLWPFITREHLLILQEVEYIFHVWNIYPQVWYVCAILYLNILWLSFRCLGKERFPDKLFNIIMFSCDVIQSSRCTCVHHDIFIISHETYTWTLWSKCCLVWRMPCGLVRIRHSPPGMPYGFVKLFLFFFILPPPRFPDAGPFQNFNRSQVMVIGRIVSFSDPARPPGGGVGRPKHPKTPPPPPKKKKRICVCVSEPQEHFWKKNLVGKKNIS